MLLVCSLVTKAMKLLPSAGSDRAWVWTVLADFADEEPKMEQLAIRLKNAESNTAMHVIIHYFTHTLDAQKFKTAFEQCQESIQDEQENEGKKEDEEDLSQNMSKLAVAEKEQSTDKSEEVKKNDDEEETQQQSDSKPVETDNDGNKQETKNEEKEKENSDENTTT